MSSIRIQEFDTWRPGYGLASVRVLIAGTTSLATIYADEDLTQALANPQTLSERVEDDISYGKFAAPVYVGTPYQLSINSVDETGVVNVPLTTLDDQDASNAFVVVHEGETETTLEDHLSRIIDVRDYGEFLAVGDSNASVTTNTATLTAALGIGGARGGGYVNVPDGTYQISAVTIPQGVILRGAGRAATTLQSTQASAVVTIGGERAGMERLTLDGISQVSSSSGVWAENKDQIHLHDCEIKRFDTGIYRYGGALSDFVNLYVSDCLYGYKAHGDLNGGDGAEFTNNYWNGGKIELCATAGVEFKYIDAACTHHVMRDVGFDTNTGDAVRITGARDLRFQDCWWYANTSNIVVADGSPLTDENSVINILLEGGSINGGTMTIAGTVEQFIMRGMELTTLAVTLTTPTNSLLVEDCREVADVTFSGTSTKWTRHKSGDRSTSSGVTTGNSATKAWSVPLEPGEKAFLVGTVVGRQRNGVNTGFYYLAVSVGRAGATLAYDSQTANFTLGTVVTGAVSGATGRIVADSDSGATGTLTIQDVEGTFVDNEALSDTSGGAATANGTQATTDAALVGSVTVLRTAQETNANWNATFVANGPEIELQVTGDTSQTVEWHVDVQVTSSG